EVPLISQVHTSDVWFNSSLEHVFYPFENSMQYLFDVLGFPATGVEVVIPDYGSTYIGILAQGTSARERIQRFQTLVNGDLNRLRGPEKEFRVLLNSIHAAQITPELIRATHELGPAWLNEARLRRLLELWNRDINKLSNVTKMLKDVEAARDWYRNQAGRW